MNTEFPKIPPYLLFPLPSALNRVKKSDCDKKETRAAVMLAAFQNTGTEFKSDLLKQLLEDKYANSAVPPPTVSNEK